jgi:predicted aspartyl protease/Tfp pilus assembly protein PilF
LVKEAESSVNAILRREPDNVRAKLDLAYIYLKQRRPLEGFDLAFPIAEADPNNSRAFAILGTVYLAAGNFAEARVLLVNSLTLDRKESLAWASLGMLNFYSNRVKESMANLKQAVYYNRREADFEYALAQVSSRVERYKEAADAYGRFLKIAPKTDIERLERIRGLIRFLGFLGTRSLLYDLGGDSTTKVKIEIVNNRPIVELRINRRKEPFRFVLDTGSGISVLSHRTAKKLGIKPVARGGVARALGGTGKFDIVYGFLNSVQIGGAKIRNVPVYIRAFTDDGPPVDGYIGLSVITRFITTLDYRNANLSLVRKDVYVEKPHSADSMTVPLRLTSSGFLSGNVELPGVESKLFFILDTGASVTVVSESLAENAVVQGYKLDRSIRVIGAAGVTDGVPMFNLRDLSFGGAERSELTAVALNLDIINETSGFEQAGIIGGNFLKDYKLTFDFKQSKVTLTPH